MNRIELQARREQAQQLLANIDEAEQLMDRIEQLTGNGAIALTPIPGGKGRPGRKTMTRAEKKAVSLRMKRYWAKRRREAKQ
jgi:hypothetical protein